MLLFRLVRFAFSCVILTIVLWFVVSVPVGRLTLWQHAVRIARTPEAQDLADGTRDVLRDTAVRVQKELATDAARVPRPESEAAAAPVPKHAPKKPAAAPLD